MLSKGELFTVTVHNVKFYNCEVSILQIFLCIFTHVNNSIDFSAGCKECSLRNVMETRIFLFGMKLLFELTLMLYSPKHFTVRLFNQLYNISASKQRNCHKIEITILED